MWNQLNLTRKLGIIGALLIIESSALGLEAQSFDNQVTVFYRCYAHLTRSRPLRNNPLLIAVKSGQIQAADACIQLIQKAEFNSAGVLHDQNDLEARATLKTLYQFHRGWFGVDNFDTRPQGPVIGGEFRHLDETEPALFLTRALFQPNIAFRTVVTSRQSMRAVRTLGAYTQLFNDMGNAKGHTQVKLDAPLAGVHRGDLLGVQALNGASTTWFDDKGGAVTDIPLHIFARVTQGYGAIPVPAPVPDNLKPIQIPRSFGAGILGTQSYLMMNSGFPNVALQGTGGVDNPAKEETESSISNGALRMHRRWAKNIMEDFMCRNLPVLRTADVSDTVNQYNRINPDIAKRIPFRESTSCMSCHATMDPMAATVRGVYFQITYQNDWNKNGLLDNLNPDRPDPAIHSRSDVTMFARMAPVTMAAETLDTTLVSRDPKFANRPGTGALRYRSYDGTPHSINLPSLNDVDGLQKLGTAVAASKDLYVCAAKKYFEYFTGLQVDLRDPGDPRNSPLSGPEERLRNIVVTLGDSLSQHQNLKTLIHDILESDIYENLGVTQ